MKKISNLSGLKEKTYAFWNLLDNKASHAVPQQWKGFSLERTVPQPDRYVVQADGKIGDRLR